MPSTKRYILILFCFFIVTHFIALGLMNLWVEEAYYWNYAEHLDWSYLDHPPMVALLIKLSTMILGLHEWSVRIPSLCCWSIALYFNIRWMKLLGLSIWPSLFFLSILPFFSLQSWVITPDQPLLAAWSAYLYYTYRATICSEKNAWYYAGISLGLGLLSKYTMFLLPLSTYLFLWIEPKQRHWLTQVTPYLALFMSFILFSPVIYWNSIHDWISFSFQSTRRLQETWHCSLPDFFGLLCLFLTPVGCLAIKDVFHRSSAFEGIFFQCHLLIPLISFMVFSLMHPIKFNWIGPSLLCALPYLTIHFEDYRRGWFITALCLSLGYTCMMVGIVTGRPSFLYTHLFNKWIDFKHLTDDILNQADQITTTYHRRPILIALDRYNIASELSFYQTQLHHPSQYIIQGSDLFGAESLMYRYWYPSKPLPGTYLLLITHNLDHFNNPALGDHTLALTAIHPIPIYHQGGIPTKKIYYSQLVKYR